MRGAYGQIRDTASRAEAIVDEIVEEYAARLDEYVDSIDAMLDDIRDGKRSEFSDSDLQRIVLRLPILMYRFGTVLDRAALESDISKAVVTSLQATHYLNAVGKTIPERKAHADLQTLNESTVVDLTKHVYQRLRNKLETAASVFDAVRKIISMRDTEKTVFGRSR